jgi:pyruvate formate lyase activating enzyme
MNIDLKGFSVEYYRDVLGGDLEMVQAFIREAARQCHVELTTLIVPGENDTEQEMRMLCQWIAGIDKGIPLHVTRFFPQFHMTDRGPTKVDAVIRLAGYAGEYLDYVYPGNI